MPKRFRSISDVDPSYAFDCVSPQVLAALFKVTRRTLANWRTVHDMPSIRIGNKRVYHLPSVMEWAFKEGKLRGALENTPFVEYTL